jgi:hypothetical protein
MNRFRLAVVVGAMGLASAVAPASAAPILFGSSYYDFVVDDAVSWADANTAASALSFNGASGHLATITTGAENSFVFSLIAPGTYTDFAGAWIGASVQGDADGTWEVGPEAGNKFSVYGYENWGGVEPNDLNANARVYMALSSLLTSVPPILGGEWVDSAGGLARAGDPIKGFFVEYQVVAATPIPAALPLFASALGGLGFLGWKRRKTRRSVSAT